MHGGDVWQGGAPGDWLDFSANIRPGGPPAWVREALLAGMADVSYYPDLRMERARRALDEYLNVGSDWVLPTAGGISAIALAVGLAPQLILFGPCFGEYARLAEQHGVRVCELSLMAGKRGLRPPSAALAGNMKAGAAVWLCNPLNPVGIAFDRREIESLLALVEAADGWLVLDEAFIHCCPRRSGVELLAEHPRLVILGSLTKSLGIPGVRAGYICAQPQLLRELSAAQTSWELNCFAEHVICALPEHREELIAEAELNAARRDSLRRDLQELGAYVYPSEASFLLADFGRDVAPIVSSLRARHILVRECADFYGVDDGRHLRLAVKDEAANAKLVVALKSALRDI